MAVVELEVEGLLTVREESQLYVVWRRFKKHRLALAGLSVLLLIIAAVILAPAIAPFDPVRDLNLSLINAPPSAEHLLGTDQIGRDVFSRLLFAGRISLFVAFTVVIISESMGAVIGAISGYFGGWVDSVIQRIVDFMLTLPLLPLILALSALLRGIELPGLSREWSSAVIIIIILTVFGWMGGTVLVRGMVLSLRNQDFTEACKALGMSSTQIILRHMLPNALAPIIVNATLGLGTVIIIESALSFLGFGIQLPVPTWGNMLNEYQADMWTQPVKVFFPGLAIFVCTLSFNYVGDGLRDAIDPRLKM